MFCGYYFKQAGATIIFSVFWYDLDPTGNWTHRTTWSVLGPPYRHLLLSAGATEDLFVTRELHQEPHPGSPWGILGMVMSFLCWCDQNRSVCWILFLRCGSLTSSQLFRALSRLPQGSASQLLSLCSPKNNIWDSHHTGYPLKLHFRIPCVFPVFSLSNHKFSLC